MRGARRLSWPSDENPSQSLHRSGYRTMVRSARDARHAAAAPDGLERTGDPAFQLPCSYAGLPAISHPVRPDRSRAAGPATDRTPVARLGADPERAVGRDRAARATAPGLLVVRRVLTERPNIGTICFLMSKEWQGLK
jgi:hypothetical protein